VSVVIGRQSLADDGSSVVDAAGVLLEALPRVRFLPVLRRANVRGALELGLVPGLLPGRVTLDSGRPWYSAHWGTVPAERGLDALGILQAAADGRIDTLVLLGADPLADFPDRDLAVRGLAGARTVIALDRFLTESSRQADIVLPVAGFAEVAGTTTNLEGRVSVLNQRVTAPGTARPDWVIAAELAAELGADLGLGTVEEIWREIEQVAPAHAGVTFEMLHAPESSDGVVIPVPVAQGLTDTVEVDDSMADADADAAADTEVAEGDSVGEATAPAGPVRPELVMHEVSPPVGAPAVDAYSLRLVATRKLYDQGTLVSASPSLAGLAPGTVLRVNPYDFDRLGVSEGDVVRVISTRATLSIAITADDNVPRGIASLVVNQPPVRASALIDASERVTDVRIETGAG
jgi:NADH-quinone oxidoreductase subunit G